MQFRVRHLARTGAFTRQNAPGNGLPREVKLEDCVATKLDSWIKFQELEHVTVPISYPIGYNTLVERSSRTGVMPTTLESGDTALQKFQRFSVTDGIWYNILLP